MADLITVFKGVGKLTLAASYASIIGALDQQGQIFQTMPYGKQIMYAGYIAATLYGLSGAMTLANGVQ